MVREEDYSICHAEMKIEWQTANLPGHDRLLNWMVVQGKHLSKKAARRPTGAVEEFAKLTTQLLKSAEKAMFVYGLEKYSLYG